MSGVVVAVSLSAMHTFSKANQPTMQLLAGLGVEGDAHMGETVKHRSRVAADPTTPNLRQVQKSPSMVAHGGIGAAGGSWQTAYAPGNKVSE